MSNISSFLEDDVMTFYKDVLPSRWSNLLPRLCQKTQRLVRSLHLKYEESEREWETDMNLLDSLLNDEYDVLQRGIVLLDELNECSDQKRSAEVFHQFLSSLLSQFALKECIAADWKKKKGKLPSDTMRVYSHAIISSFSLIDKASVDRVKLIVVR